MRKNRFTYQINVKYVNFQDILCSGNCSEEAQKEIISFLATFVHNRSDEIDSGWRPLFGALRALHTTANFGQFYKLILIYRIKLIA